MNKERIPYAMICAAKAGESEAMAAVLRHYAPYISFYSNRKFRDEYGNQYEFVDDDIRQRIEAKLMYQIIYKFDPSRLPDAEAE